ncbi:MAG TPA: flagellar basal body P-ring formation chaperone FlgA [Burkholderiaceae bacterium]|nr:flagellar basal body P-ring formation chaperone FlgA [Burkholderiaceae bacterium]HMM51038.1 flagellar basal body P-ring formation chaperone FlgA [Burkholderiaceae bacterium]
MLSDLPNPKRPPTARRIGAAVFGAALSVAAGAAATAAPSADPDTAGLQRWVEESVAAAWAADRAAGAGSRAAGADPEAAAPRVEVRVGSLGTRPRLPACARLEPFLPPNARLWGPSHIGVRCTQGGSWSMMVPVTVSVYGPALVADRPLAAGASADPGSFRIDQVDLTRARGAPVADPALLAGRTLARPLSAGEPLRAEDLRVPQTVAAGDPVQIRLLGQGFTVSSDGFALAGAGEGQSLRVRTSAGKMLVGTVRARVVEVRL